MMRLRKRAQKWISWVQNDRDEEKFLIRALPFRFDFKVIAGFVQDIDSMGDQ